MTNQRLEATASLLWRRPGHADCESGARITFEDATITGVEVGKHGIDNGRLLMPALVNAHDHIRGLRHLAFGARDEIFETWRATLYANPKIDVYTNACLALGRMALAGIGTTLCVHSSIKVDRLIQDAQDIARAARDTGLRVGFVVPFRNQNTMALGDDRAVLALQHQEDRETIESTWLYPWPSIRTYIEIAREIGKLESETFFVQYGPNSPHACSDDLMEAIVAASAEDNRRIHMHFLESEPQRQWADSAFPQGFFRHYDAMGLFSELFTGAHGIWLSDEECDLLSGRGASVAVNTSSNLHLHSGLSPISRYLKAGLKFAFGLDSFSLDDDEDMMRELRLSYYLHSIAHRPPCMTPAILYDAALRDAFWIVSNRRDYGAIAPGAPADLLSIDFASMTRDLIEGMVEPADAMMARASSRYVKDLWVAGRRIVEDGHLRTIDIAAAAQEVQAQAEAAGDQMRALKPLLSRHKATLRKFYDSGSHILRLS